MMSLESTQPTRCVCVVVGITVFLYKPYAYTHNLQRFALRYGSYFESRNYQMELYSELLNITGSCGKW